MPAARLIRTRQASGVGPVRYEQVTWPLIS
jgi:hypothetical protein